MLLLFVYIYMKKIMLWFEGFLLIDGCTCQFSCQKLEQDAWGLDVVLGVDPGLGKKSSRGFVRWRLHNQAAQ